MPTPQLFSAKLADKLTLSHKFIQLFFELVTPNYLEFTAGQYISIAVHPDGHRRAYSICSSPGKSHGFELLVEIFPSGMGSEFLNTLQFGDEITFLAPLGTFTVAPEIKDQPVTFVATGSGIAPFRSMILDQLQQQGRTLPITSYWGLRHSEDLFWQDEFQQLADEYPQFHFHPVLSQPGAEWPLCTGRVTDCLFVHELTPAAQYYLCGSSAMIEDTTRLLTERGVEKELIHREKFY